MIFNESYNLTLYELKFAVLSKWTIIDGIILLIVLLIWLVTFCSFMKKWGNFRVPLPRDIIRKFKPMNVDQVKIIDRKKENRSVIYKTYGKQIQDTMNDRERRLKISRDSVKIIKSVLLDTNSENEKDKSNSGHLEVISNMSALEDKTTLQNNADILSSQPSLFGSLKE